MNSKHIQIHILYFMTKKHIIFIISFLSFHKIVLYVEGITTDEFPMNVIICFHKLLKHEAIISKFHWLYLLNISNIQYTVVK